MLYARVSSKEQDEGFSIPAQEKLLREHANRHGFEVVREFVDVETAKEAGRGQFGEMVQFLGRKGGDCRIVLVENLRRIAKRVMDSGKGRQTADDLADRLLGAGRRATE